MPFPLERTAAATPHVWRNVLSLLGPARPIGCCARQGLDTDTSESGDGRPADRRGDCVPFESVVSKGWGSAKRFDLLAKFDMMPRLRVPQICLCCPPPPPPKKKSGLAEARRGAEPGLAPRASGRKERLGASGLTRTLCDAHARVSMAALCTMCM